MQNTINVYTYIWTSTNIVLDYINCNGRQESCVINISDNYVLSDKSSSANIYLFCRNLESNQQHAVLKTNKEMSEKGYNN